MSEHWYREYIQLALCIDKLFHTLLELPFVDYYYGPQEWKTQIEHEPEREPAELVRAAMALLDTLPQQSFDQHRMTCLSKQVIAMETICRKLNGEPFSFEEDMRRLFDVQFVWTPESQFEEALALYDTALPGKGRIADRLHEWRARHRLPWHWRKRDFQQHLRAIVNRLLAETRQRTLAFVDLPEGEGIEVQLQADERFGGACWYEGNYRSHVEINVAEHLQGHVDRLVDTFCHEVYPGHHVDYTLKDWHLYRKRGYVEEAIGLIVSPRALVGEGIANYACDMLWSPYELEQWLAQHVYPEAEIEPDEADVEKIRRAAELLDGVWGNAVSMLRDGRPDEEVDQYLTKYLRHGGHTEFLKKPFLGFFPVVEYYGKRLMRPWLQGPNRQQVFKRFLTEQWCPSELVNPIGV